MAHATPYTRKQDFTAIATADPYEPIPGDKLDTEFDDILRAINEVILNQNLMQRSDGEQENRSIGVNQLKSELLTTFGQLTPTRTKEYIYDIAIATDTVSGADRDGNTLEYVAAATGVIGSHIDMYVDGELIDPADTTHTDGTSVVRSTNFPNPSVVVIHVGEAEYAPTTDIETLDDITASFDGVTTTFPMTVGAQPRIVANAARLDVYLDFAVPDPTDTHGATIQQPNTDYTVSGSNIIFTTAPGTGTVFWATLRVLTAIEASSITTALIANDAVTGDKILDGTIPESKLDFNISQIPVGGGIDWYDSSLPANIPTGSMVFPVGQTCGKCGSGASIEDDDIEEAFNIFKKRWGNLGTEDFDSLDIILLPDLRGTTMVVPDKGASRVLTDNTVGSRNGLEYLPARVLTGSATTSGVVDGHVLTIAEMPDHDHNVASNDLYTDPLSGESGGDSFPTTPISLGFAQGGDQPHDHVVTTLPLDHTNLRTGQDRIMQPYTVCEKLIRIK